MINKHIICPERLRRIPKQFSWIDHRLVRHGYLRQCSSQALALYLFLTTVGDADGLSYYSETSICKQLNFPDSTLCQARKELINRALIAYRKPLYQVLGLDRKYLNAESITAASERANNLDAPSRFNQKPTPPHLQVRAEEPLHIGKIINQIQRRFEP